MKYTEEHDWLRVEGELVVVGITKFATEQLGDVVFVELPDPGTLVSRLTTITMTLVWWLVLAINSRLAKWIKRGS